MFEENFGIIYLQAAILFYEQQIDSFVKYKIDDFENINKYLIKLHNVMQEEISKNNKHLNFPDWIVEIYKLSNLKVSNFKIKKNLLKNSQSF